MLVIFEAITARLTLLIETSFQQIIRVYLTNYNLKTFFNCVVKQRAFWNGLFFILSPTLK